MRVTIVLVAPARAENIGAAARAMKTMGFTDLRIVDSQAHLEPATRWVAHGSGDIIDNIEVFQTLADALHDVDFTVATTARSRAKFHYYASPAELVPLLQEKSRWMRHAALVFGDISGKTPVLARVHSECLTGDALFSLRCDCGFQLEAALTHIAEEGRGILIYHRQEGRNIGLLNKIRAYALQDQGYDTVEANHQLGFAANERDFTLCADMFKLLGVDEVRLLTNNPKKVEILTEAGINIVERVPLIVGRNPNNEHYLDTKAAKMGHLLSK